MRLEPAPAPPDVRSWIGNARSGCLVQPSAGCRWARSIFDGRGNTIAAWTPRIRSEPWRSSACCSVRAASCRTKAMMCRYAEGCRGAELDAFFRRSIFSQERRGRFPPSGPRPRSNGSSSLRGRTRHRGFRLSVPDHNRSSAAAADRLFSCNSACRRVESRRSYPAGNQNPADCPMDGDRGCASGSLSYRAVCGAPMVADDDCSLSSVAPGDCRRFPASRRVVASRGCGSPAR